MCKIWGFSDDDAKNNTKSLNRKLDKHLVLLVDQKVGDQEFSIFPQDKWQQGETLRQVGFFEYSVTLKMFTFLFVDSGKNSQQ